MGKHSKTDPFSEVSETEKDRSAIIAEAGEYILQYFKPALSLNDATNTLTTEEVYLAIKRLNPSTEVNITDIFAMMEENGFIYTPDPNQFTFEFKWLLIRIS